MWLFLAVTWLAGALPSIDHGDIVLTRDDGAHVTLQLSVTADGHWQRADGAEGELDRGSRQALTTLVRALGKSRHEAESGAAPGSHCPSTTLHLGVHGAHGTKGFDWIEGCGDYPSLAVERLVHFLRRTIFVEAIDQRPTFILSLRQGKLGRFRGDGPDRELIIQADGRWSEQRGADVSRGRLGADVVLRLAELARALVRPDAPPALEDGLPCEALTTDWYQVRVGAARFGWKDPCGSKQPSRDLMALIGEARAAVEASKLGVQVHPPGFARPSGEYMLRVRTGPLGQAASRETVIMADGSWRSATARGRLGADDLAALTRLIGQTTFALAPDDGGARCMAEPDRFTTVETGAGASVTWNAPCEGAPDPSVGRLLQAVQAFTGPGGP